MIRRANYGMSIRKRRSSSASSASDQFIPLAGADPVAGWAADRFEQRRVAIFSNMIVLTIAASLVEPPGPSRLTLPLLFTLAALHGVARVFSGPAMSAIAPNIVPPPTVPAARDRDEQYRLAICVGDRAGGGRPDLRRSPDVGVLSSQPPLLVLSAFTVSRVTPGAAAAR